MNGRHMVNRPKRPTPRRKEILKKKRGIRTRYEGGVGVVKGKLEWKKAPSAMIRGKRTYLQ